MKKKINMISKVFAHTISSTVNRVPQNIEWDFFNRESEISFYIDYDIFKGFSDKNDEKRKIHIIKLKCPFLLQEKTYCLGLDRR